MRRKPSLQRGLTALSIVAISCALTATFFGFPRPVLVIANLTAIAAAVGAWLTAPPEDSDSELVAEVSHELRTPLTGILGTLEILTEPTMPLEKAEVDEL